MESYMNNDIPLFQTSFIFSALSIVNLGGSFQRLLTSLLLVRRQRQKKIIHLGVTFTQQVEFPSYC